MKNKNRRMERERKETKLGPLRVPKLRRPKFVPFCFSIGLFI